MEIVKVLNPDFKEMLSALSAAGVDFLLVDAYAMAVHGTPRATGDLDIWVRATEANAARIMRALIQFGAPVESVTAEDFCRPNIVVQIGVAPRRLDFLTTIDGVEFDTAWRNRMSVIVDGVGMP